MRVRYLHSEVDTLERVEILRGLRLGEFDVLVGINLLREGLDLPEVSLVAILDADKEGFLRSETVADPDHRPRRPQRRRPGDHVRRPDDRLDAPGDLGDQPAAQDAARVQRRARHRPADGAQEGHRHPRDAARLRRRRSRRRGRGRGRGTRPPTAAVGGVRPRRRAARRPRPPHPDAAGRDARRGHATSGSRRRRACATRSPSSSASCAPSSDRRHDRPPGRPPRGRGHRRRAARRRRARAGRALDGGRRRELRAVRGRARPRRRRRRADRVVVPRLRRVEPHPARPHVRPAVRRLRGCARPAAPRRHPPLLPRRRRRRARARRPRPGAAPVGDVLHRVGRTGRGARTAAAGDARLRPVHPRHQHGARSGPTPRAARSSWSGRPPTSRSAPTAPRT